VSIKPVVPRALARADVDDALAYYVDEAGRDVALAFIDALETAYRHLSRHAKTGSSAYAYELDIPQLRFWPLRRFPFLIFYMEHDDHIDVWRVLHAQRDIPAWLRKE
jgi:toxin ParE1/3/4